MTVGFEFALATLGIVHIARPVVEGLVVVGAWLDERKTDRLAR